jgi:hypothetical protein
MFDSSEASGFLSGQGATFLVFSYRGDADKFWFEREQVGRVLAFVPIRCRIRDDPFDIAKAMKEPSCNVDFTIEGSYYRIELHERRQLYTIFKLACNQLDWVDQAHIEKEYLQTIPSEWKA